MNRRREDELKRVHQAQRRWWIRFIAGTVAAFTISVLVAQVAHAQEAQIQASGTIDIEWQPPTENEDGSELTDLAGYTIKWGREAGQYTDSLTVDDAGQTTATLNLSTDRAETPYFIVMTARDEEGNESAHSNEVARLLRIIVEDSTPPGAPSLSTEIRFTLESCVVVSNPSATCTVTFK